MAELRNVHTVQCTEKKHVDVDTHVDHVNVFVEIINYAHKPTVLYRTQCMRVFHDVIKMTLSFLGAKKCLPENATKEIAQLIAFERRRKIKFALPYEKLCNLK
jgi:hypothetical protein